MMKYPELSKKIDGAMIGIEDPVPATIYLEGLTNHMLRERTTEFPVDVPESALQALTLPEIVEEVSKQIEGYEKRRNEPCFYPSPADEVERRIGIELDRYRGMYQLLRGMLAEEGGI
ncbi:MAG: hypothetical protein AABY26_00480 [Nanoarchaeota archaeon]